MQVSSGTSELRGVVAIGASAGGVEALSQLVAGLSPDLPYAYLITLHMPTRRTERSGADIDRRGPLPAATAAHGTKIEAAHIYVAAPDHHLLVADHETVLSHGPTENGHRPSINALFRSVAVTFGSRAIGVLLSGVLDDGVLGLRAIRARGGTTIGQTPEDAMFPALPTNAANAGVLDRQISAAGVGSVLKELAQREIHESDTEPDATLELENRIAMAPRFTTDLDTETFGPASGYTCPDCNGSLVTLKEKSFRCRVGHAWSPESLLAARDAEVETALWVALRSLQEKAKLARQLADRTGQGSSFRRYDAVAEEAERALAVLSARLAAILARHEGTGD